MKNEAALIATMREMLEELKFLTDECTHLESRFYADGTEYEIEIIKAYGKTVERIRELIVKAETLLEEDACLTT